MAKLRRRSLRAVRQLEIRGVARIGVASLRLEYCSSTVRCEFRAGGCVRVCACERERIERGLSNNLVLLTFHVTHFISGVNCGKKRD